MIPVTVSLSVTVTSFPMTTPIAKPAYAGLAQWVPNRDF
jgi:hypothetical protein